MKPMIKCELAYFPSPHLSQIYAGFGQLKKIGIVELSLSSKLPKNPPKPLLTVNVNEKYTVIYDTLDGLNWIDGTIEENLNYFKNNIKADFYFKRSYNKNVFEHAPRNCQIFPLGLNYDIRSEPLYFKGITEKVKDILICNKFSSKLLKLNNAICTSDFEFYPLCNEIKILFLTRLWNPDDVSLEHLKTERESINKNRISCIRACQNELGNSFTGGLVKDSFSIQAYKELTSPRSLTDKREFLKAIKSHSICIATTGLHNSIGWRFGEYVAASRGIITEPLAYDLPGEFESGKNYLKFCNETELLNQILFLREHPKLLFEMMNNNYHYYNNYLKPGNLILNTLLTVLQN